MQKRLHKNFHIRTAKIYENYLVVKNFIARSTESFELPQSAFEPVLR